MAQTTRTQVRGVLNRPDAQVVFVDTPGIHKPRTLLGERLNDTATAAVSTASMSSSSSSTPPPSWERVTVSWPSRLPGRPPLCVVNKIDAASRAGDVWHQLRPPPRAGTATSTFRSRRRRARGSPRWCDAIVARMPEGPRLYPDDMVTDVPEAFWVAELVREQLLAVTRDEVPHSIACRVTEWEWPRIRCEILVERDSQKGIVIGRGGAVLKEVGSRVRDQLAPGAYLELVVKVDQDWQSRPRALERLGY